MGQQRRRPWRPRGLVGASTWHRVSAGSSPWRLQAGGLGSRTEPAPHSRLGQSQDRISLPSDHVCSCPRVLTAQRQPLSAGATGGLCPQTLPPGIRGYGKYFPLSFGSAEMRALVLFISPRPVRALPQPTLLTMANQGIQVVRSCRLLDVCCSSRGGGTVPGDPVPYPHHPQRTPGSSLSLKGGPP